MRAFWYSMPYLGDESGKGERILEGVEFSDGNVVAHIPGEEVWDGFGSFAEFELAYTPPPDVNLVWGVVTEETQ